MPARLDRKFEKFLGGPTKPPEERFHVTITDRNVITVNAKCWRTLGKPKAVYLHFSRFDDIIALEPVDSYNMPSAFPLKQNQTAWYINAAPFCRHFGIRITETRRFINPDFRDDALQLKLSETVSVRRERRMRKKT